MYIQDIDLKIEKWDFNQRKNLPYDIKLSITQTRIVDFDHKFDTYVSFSGGLDSTVLLDMIRRFRGNHIPAVFCDTGLEFPEIRKFVDEAANIYGNVKIIKPKMDFVSVLKTYGYPFPSKEIAESIRKLRHGNLCDRYRNYLLNGDERGKIGMVPKKWQYLQNVDVEVSEKCCDIMKKHPFAQYEKETGRYPYIGITQDESFRRARQYSRTGCNIVDGKHPRSMPMGPWGKQDVLRYIVENDVKYCSVYGDIYQDDKGLYHTTGEQRTGCMFCLFGIHMEETPNRIQRLADTHPQIYDYIMRGGKFDASGIFRPDKGLGYRQLQGVFGLELEPPAQMSFFEKGARR